MKSFSSEIKISKDVFATICEIALKELDCIACVDKVKLSGRLFDTYATRDNLSIKLYVQVKAGCKIRAVADDASRIASGHIAKMTGIVPDSVNIYVTDMVQTKKNTKHGIGG